ncbi:hypothetical protein U9M48_005624 [Paspalum notatum var. saurae]|uniref:TNase-like domain-containing protein n=1 Tax=Paspalum notatum var. saurae TaxID=547442 RepID=A0AAQ3PMS7_PASNO
MPVTSESKEPVMDNIFATSGRRVDAPREERGRHPRGAVSVKMHAFLFASLFLLMAKGIFAFYNHPAPSLPAASDHHQSSLPEGVQFVLNTLPVHYKCIGDGDGFSAYVDTAIPRESANVPLEVHEMVMERTQARTARDYQKADALLGSLDEAGYKGVDALELKMANGEESKNALVELICGKRVTVYVYGQDQFERYVGDIYCDNVFIQERMLKSGHVWHFKNYDKRPEFAQWEREARAARRVLFASENPEKPWHWRRDQLEESAAAAAQQRVTEEEERA